MILDILIRLVHTEEWFLLGSSAHGYIMACEQRSRWNHFSNMCNLCVIQVYDMVVVKNFLNEHTCMQLDNCTSFLDITFVQVSEINIQAEWESVYMT